MKTAKGIFFLWVLCGLGACTPRALLTAHPPETTRQTETRQLDVAPAEPKTISMLAVGDNLYHASMIREGEEGDYASAYAELRPLIEAADIAFVNQETLLAGKAFGFSGYPRFNSPQKLGQALAEVGFNVINHATNHVLDKGEKALLATMDFWDTFPHITVLGIHRSPEARSQPKLLKKNNITVGFLSYTYGTNGFPLPADKPHLVSLIDTEIMAREIEALRPLCDFLVVSMHWGEEYVHEPSEEQKKLATFLAAQQVDVLIGHHPHVIQPMEYIQRPDGKWMLCFYSLGNFISAQVRAPRMLGAMAYLKIEEGAGEERFVLLEAGAIPLVTHYEKEFVGFKVYPLYAYTEALADQHRMNQQKKELTLDYLQSLASKVFGDKEIKHNPFAP
ncbi:MAG: CapA family protein [Cystobacterineae bacterium]|nr:CapA family protein [Cystobacterineae bacterium]